MIPAKWTDDCSGKKDFDGAFVSLSCRYWPKGGSAFSLDTTNNKGLQKYDDGSRASASCQLLLNIGDGDYRILTSTPGYLEGDSESEVKAKVENWAADVYGRVLLAVDAEFSNKSPIRQYAVEIDVPSLTLESLISSHRRLREANAVAEEDRRAALAEAAQRGTDLAKQEALKNGWFSRERLKSMTLAELSQLLNEEGS